MSQPQTSAPVRSGVFCAVHAERTAATLCNRCGSYACESCFQVAHDRQDYCLSCLPRVRPALAERGTRLAAALVDQAVVLGPVFLSVVAAGVLTTMQDDPGLFAGVFTFLCLAVPALLCSGAWQLYLLVTTGQSVGKRVMGIKVVRTDGGPVALSRLIFLRNLVPAIIDLPFSGIFSLIDKLVIFTEPRRCLHDHIADTQVVVVPRSK